MKLFYGMVFGIGLLLTGASQVVAAPSQAVDKNPQIVSYYPDGVHGIVGESAYHTGMDIVMKAGKSGVVQQWFYGNEYDNPTGNGEPARVVGHHTVFRPAENGSCPDGWYTLFDINGAPDRFWGDHFETGADYCVRTNDFKLGNE